MELLGIIISIIGLLGFFITLGIPMFKISVLVGIIYTFYTLIVLGKILIEVAEEYF